MEVSAVRSAKADSAGQQPLARMRAGPPGSMRHDQAYKALFSYPQAVQDLLREFVAEQLEGGHEWVGRLDVSTLEPLPTERIDTTLRGRANDLVWQVRVQDASGGPSGCTFC